MRLYLDTSAIVKTVLEEQFSREYQRYLNQVDTVANDLVSSLIGYTEARRTLLRQEVPAETITRLLSGLRFTELTMAVAHSAGLYPNNLQDSVGNNHLLKSSDAIHIATAIQFQVDFFVTYDHNQLLYATELGLRVMAPGLTDQG